MSPGVSTHQRNKQIDGRGRSDDFPRLLGGRLCLHFVNTIEAPRREHPVEFIHSYRDLVQWCWHASALEEDDVDRLDEVATVHAEEAEAVFKGAVEFRSVIDRVFRHIAAGRSPADADLAELQEAYVAALDHARISLADDRLKWSWDRDAPDLKKPLWLITHSSIELLREGDLSRLKECPGAGDCGWLFYDSSRQGGRRWCSMEGCGSRVKMRRHYARQKKRAADG